MHEVQVASGHLWTLGRDVRGDFVMIARGCWIRSLYLEVA